MARTVKNNCEYFPHLTTMRNHKKVKALRNKFGQVSGYAFWSMFVEYLTEQDGNEIENSEMEFEMFAGELGVSVTEIRDMIDYCLKIELLFLSDENFIYSESLNENLQPVYDKRKRAKESSKTRKRRENGNFCDSNTTGVDETVTETPQSKVEYSKEEKRREEGEKEKPTKKNPIVINLEPFRDKMLIPISECETEMIKDEITLNNNAMKYHLNPDLIEVREWLVEFFSTQRSEGVTEVTLKDSRSYFSRWLNKQLINKKTDGQKVSNVGEKPNIIANRIASNIERLAAEDSARQREPGQLRAVCS